MKHGYKLVSVYSNCGISKQGHYKSVEQQKSIEQKEPLYIGFIVEIRIMHPGMGLRSIYETYEPSGIGRDAFIALGLRNGFRIRAVHKTVRTTYSVKSNRYSNLLEGKRFTDVNQIWTSDITYFKIGEETYYIVFIMDVYSRRIVGYSVANNMRAEQNIEALQMALDLRGKANYNQKLIHHSDKGGQYISDDYTELLTEYGIRISLCNIVYENAHIERVNGIIKNQYLYRWKINNFHRLRKKLQDAVWAYNFEKQHRSLDKSTPIDFEESIKDIPVEKRAELIIYTHKQNDDGFNATQLELDL